MVNIINIFSYPEINELKTPKNKGGLDDVIKNDFVSFSVNIRQLKIIYFRGRNENGSH